MGIPRNGTLCKKCGKLISAKKGLRHVEKRCGTAGRRFSKRK